MRCIIDTNVLISAFLKDYSIPGLVFRKAADFGTLLFSDATLGELIAVIYRKKFDHYTSDEARKNFLAQIIDLSEMVNPLRSFDVCRDPNDNKFLEAAVFGDADYIITGDEDLLLLHPFMKVGILTPADFLELPLK